MFFLLSILHFYTQSPMPDYSIPSGKKKHFRINPLSCPFFSPLFTLRKLIYIPKNKETHHIYKISIPKISKHIFIPAKKSTFRTAKMGCLSAPHFRYFPLFTGILPLLLPKDMSLQTTIYCGIHTFFHHIYTISSVSRATVSTCPVCGNMSTGVPSTNPYPSAPSSFTSRARVAGSQDT